MNKRILDLAIEEAYKSTYKQQLGSVIFNKRYILSCGHNYGMKSARNLHPRFQKWFGSIHAEVDCILKAKKDLVGSSILVVRINNKGELRNAKPCEVCMGYLTHVGIRRIFYSTNEGEIRLIG